MNDPFPTTIWSEVQYQSSQGSAGARAALATLYETYWSPLYAYLRRRRLEPEAAQDVLQSFYSHLFERDVVAKLDRERGLLRAFLLTALKNFLADQQDRERARVRSPETPLFSLDVLAEETRYQAIDSEQVSPEQLFEIRWASKVAARARENLSSRELAAGNGEAFAILEEHIFGGRTTQTYQQISDTLGVSVSAIKLRVHRYRKRLGQLLRHEIQQTVTEPTSVDQELRHLLECLSRPGT